MPTHARGAPRRVAILPTTTLGRRALLFAVLGVVLVPTWAILPGGALLAFALQVAGGILALVAVTRHHERAVAVYAALVPFAFVVAFVVAELAGGDA